MFYYHLVHFIAIWYFHGHLVHFMSIWYILLPFGLFSHIGMLCKEKSGNPDLDLFPNQKSVPEALQTPI
jgi:hypothetical protein